MNTEDALCSRVGAERGVRHLDEAFLKSGSHEPLLEVH